MKLKNTFSWRLRELLLDDIRIPHIYAEHIYAVYKSVFNGIEDETGYPPQRGLSFRAFVGDGCVGLLPLRRCAARGKKRALRVELLR